jgi:putative endonuclease
MDAKNRSLASHPGSLASVRKLHMQSRQAPRAGEFCVQKARTGTPTRSMAKDYYVYILANTRVDRPVIYVAVTSSLARRVAEHRFTCVGFTWRYKVTTLVCVEAMKDIYLAIQREKQIQGWTRAKKSLLLLQQIRVGPTCSRHPKRSRAKLRMTCKMLRGPWFATWLTT